jgi:hypothetical protein
VRIEIWRADQTSVVAAVSDARLTLSIRFAHLHFNADPAATKARAA